MNDDEDPLPVPLGLNKRGRKVVRRLGLSFVVGCVVFLVWYVTKRG